MEKKLLLQLISMLVEGSKETKVNDADTCESAGVEECKLGSDYIGEYVIMRGYDSGVLFGKLEKIEGGSYYLQECRRLYYRKTNGVALEDVATKGLLTGSKVTCTIDRVQITDQRISLIIPTNKKVTKQIKEYSEYTPS